MTRLSILIDRVSRKCVSVLRPEKPSEFGIFGRLPLEIRIEIWRYAQTMPFGRVTVCMRPRGANRWESDIVRFDPERYVRTPGRARFLPLLQTSKAIYQETRGIFYQVNTFCFHSQEDFARRFKQLDTPSLSMPIKHVWIGVNIALESLGPSGLPETADVLSTWQKKAGTLRTITLYMIDYSLGFGLKKLVERYRESGPWLQRLINIFRDFQFQSEGLWEGVTMRLEFNVDDHRDATLINDARDLFKCLHDALGGELWVADKLCYKDGAMIVRPFENNSSRD